MNNPFKIVGASLVVAAVNVNPVNAHSLSAALLPYAGINADGGTSARGTGLSLHANIDVHGDLFAYGEIVRRTFSDDLRGVNVDNYRAGIGYSVPQSPLYVGINLEQYRQVASGFGSTKVIGGGARVGMNAPIGKTSLHFMAEVAGSLYDGNFQTYEGMVGLSLPVTSNASIYGSYRFTYLDQGDSVTSYAAFDDVILGMRFDM